ncbi:MAG: hypothetical protein EOO03_12845, partial [Chitinophagaceae bacterium]
MQAAQNSPNRSYYLSFEPRPDYLLARVSGTAASLSTSRAYWNDIAREVGSRQAKRLLVWEDFDGMISTQDTFILVNELCRLKSLVTLRLALLDEYLDQLDRNKLGEMIANN